MATSKPAGWSGPVILAAALLGMAAAAAAPLDDPAALVLAVLSSRPDMVSGGDALIEIKLPPAVSAQKLEVTLNGRDVTQAFRENAARRSLTGLVDGLRDGRNALVAKAGSASATLSLTNHPLTGPILSGEHLKPFVCMTAESGLGEPLDADCSARTRIEYFYRSNATAEGSFKPLADPLGPRPSDLAQTTTSQGKTVPYIVRVESGTINRAIYRIAIPDDRPGDPDGARRQSWNRRIVYGFGGGCGTNYNQGRSTAASALFDPALSRGFAYITSTQNVMQQHCNDHLSGEALMMIKEHFIKRYGLPEWTMGIGGSGGSIQQLLIAQNFPGLLDGLLPSLTFPDSATVRSGVTDCRLLLKLFERDPATWTQDKRTAVEGYTPGTCAAWNRSFVDVIVAANAKGCGIAPELVYDPVRNPKGARCTIWDTNAATFGRDPETGFARPALDNVGVQYGLSALHRGAISKREFLDLNRDIGGYDRDGNVRAARTAADPQGVRMAYLAGRVDSGAGALATIPILHYRSYNDSLGDIHDRFRDFAVRERLRKANGSAGNQVIWVYPNGNRALAAKVAALAIDTMSQWLDTRARPAAATDGCWTADGVRIDEPATFDGPGQCNILYPVHQDPRLVAGAPLSDDVVKCRLKPVNPADYGVAFTASEMDELRSIFPGGVCDYSHPGVNQTPPAGTYLKLPMETATSAATAGRLYFLDLRGGRVVATGSDGSGVQVLLQGHRTGMDGIAVDADAGHLYWTNMGKVSVDDGSIERANLDGTDLVTIVPAGGTFTPKQLKLDKAHGRLYWADREGMRIMRANLDGSQVETLVETAHGDEARRDARNWCVGIALDLGRGQIYWTQKGGDNAGLGTIRRAGIELPAGQDPAHRTDIEVLQDGLPEPIDLDLDLGTRTMYWTDRGDPPRGNTVNRAPMDPPADHGRAPVEVLVSGLHEGIGIALDLKGGRMFFTDLGGSVYSARLDGSDRKVLLTGQGSLTGIAYVEPGREYNHPTGGDR